MANKQPKSRTLSTYRALKATRVSFFVLKYLAPCIPAIIITIIHWDEWIDSIGWRMPMGMATLLISVVLSIVAISKKDAKENKHVSPLFYIAIVTALYGVSFVFLASILSSLGMMFLYTALGVLAGAVVDQLNATTIKDFIAEYKTLVEENGLDPRYVAKQKRKEARKQLAVQEAQTKALAEAGDSSKGRY